jgi:hypothetical protein
VRVPGFHSSASLQPPSASPPSPPCRGTESARVPRAELSGRTHATGRQTDSGRRTEETRRQGATRRYELAGGLWRAHCALRAAGGSEGQRRQRIQRPDHCKPPDHDKLAHPLRSLARVAICVCSSVCLPPLPLPLPLLRWLVGWLAGGGSLLPVFLCRPSQAQPLLLALRVRGWISAAPGRQVPLEQPSRSDCLLEDNTRLHRRGRAKRRRTESVSNVDVACLMPTTPKRPRGAPLRRASQGDGPTITPRPRWPSSLRTCVPLAIGGKSSCP